MSLPWPQARARVVFWFRADLRLHDAVALVRSLQRAAEAGADWVPVVVLPAQPPVLTRWGFARESEARRRWRADAVRALAWRLHQHGSGLVVLDSVQALGRWARDWGAAELVCEAIEAPEEQAEVAQLRAQGVSVETVWHSSLLHPDDLPWPADSVPVVFTAFRQGIERQGCQPRAPLAEPAVWPPWPPDLPRPQPDPVDLAARPLGPEPVLSPRWASGHPLDQALRRWHALPGSEAAGLDHLQRYLAGPAPRRYKLTRNALSGWSHSSRWSLWLAQGALSPRRVLAELRAHESVFGANESTYWLWFELLWRDHFRCMHRRFGARLYRAEGLSERAADRSPPHDEAALVRWCAGTTGEPLVDAGMRELASTGWLSNRMRQIVASYLIHELRCDWRAGAAWFESQLLDFDPYSNQGNWAYIAGRGTDPRGGRHFDLQRQARQHDPDGRYRAAWAAVALPASGA